MKMIKCNKIAEGKAVKIGEIIIIGTKKPTHGYELAKK